MFSSNPNQLPGTSWAYNSTHGLKRPATDEMLIDASQYTPPSKFPAHAHHWKQSAAMRPGNNNGFNGTQPDDDIELDLVEEVNQTLKLNESTSSIQHRAKRKSNFSTSDYNKFSSPAYNDESEDEEACEGVKRMRMDCDDEPQQSFSTYGNGPLALTDRNTDSKEVTLCDEIQALMENMCEPPKLSSPESIIIERIQKRNAMALVPWKPLPSDILEKVKANEVNLSLSKPMPKPSFTAEAEEGDNDHSSDDSDQDSIIIENSKGVLLSSCMEEDEYDEDD